MKENGSLPALENSALINSIRFTASFVSKRVSAGNSQISFLKEQNLPISYC